MTDPTPATPDEDADETPVETVERRPRTALRTTVRWLQRIVVALVGATLGVLLLGRVEAPIGPFDATVAFTPATTGGAELEIPRWAPWPSTPTTARSASTSSCAGWTSCGRRRWPPTPASSTAWSTGSART
ncbi:hypothetical protein ACFQX8_26075 [Klenkia terrae]|uniref:hypothetical protein n=1 Tax=Klenkia terrae TaxID=1052259 RepID=UPI00361D3F6C